MEIKEIEALIKAIDESSLTEFTYKNGDVEIKMSKMKKPPMMNHPKMPMGPGMPPMGPGVIPCSFEGMPKPEEFKKPENL